MIPVAKEVSTVPVLTVPFGYGRLFHRAREVLHRAYSHVSKNEKDEKVQANT